MSRVLLASVPRKSYVNSFDKELYRSFVSLPVNGPLQLSNSVIVHQKRHGSSMNVILLENVANRGKIYRTDYS